LYQKEADAGVNTILQAFPRVIAYAKVMVDALGMVSRDTRPEHEVEVSDVSGIEPDAEIVMAFVPSSL
jgi:hypothetical protein